MNKTEDLIHQLRNHGATMNDGDCYPAVLMEKAANRIEELVTAVGLLTGPALLGALSVEEVIEDFGNLGVDNYQRALALARGKNED